MTIGGIPVDIVRLADPGLLPMRIRADSESDNLGLLTVRFSPFNTWYRIESWWEGNFYERTVRGAFAKTFAEQGSNIRCLFNHGYDGAIGNKVLMPTEDLREDPDSAVIEGHLFDTAYNRELLPGLQAGVYGSSFRFEVIKEEWNEEPGVSDHNPEGWPERTITEVRCKEAGPVTFPASPTATASVRSDTDRYYDMVRGAEPDRYEILRSKVPTRSTPSTEAGSSTSAADGAAPGKIIHPGERRRALYL